MGAARLAGMDGHSPSRLRAALDSGRCYVVAEAGSNHCGELDTALRLVDVAAEAGADAVKFQLFTADRMYPPGAGVADYLGDPTSIDEIIRTLELAPEWLPELAGRAAERGLDFLATPFDEEAVDVLEPYVPAYKIASYELTHAPLLRYVAAKGKPVVLSTGAATLEEAREAVATLREAGAPEVVVLQCTARYPAPLETLGIGAIPQLRAELDAPVGLSDHSREPLIGPIAAVALGACMLEKHFTLSNDLPGPDHRFALEPPELAAMVAAVRATEAARGSGRKEVYPEEEELRSFARRTLFSVRPIDAGETLDKGSIAVLRAGKLGHGLEPAALGSVLGRRAVRAIAPHVPIRREDVEWS